MNQFQFNFKLQMEKFILNKFNSLHLNLGPIYQKFFGTIGPLPDIFLEKVDKKTIELFETTFANYVSELHNMYMQKQRAEIQKFYQLFIRITDRSKHIRVIKHHCHNLLDKTRLDKFILGNRLLKTTYKENNMIMTLL